MISIITRCYNRLEYTIQVVNNVRLTADMDYEHIIVDNNSNDGTYEWFSWMSQNTNWIDNLKYIRMSYNYGDWEGMVKGFEHIDENSKYVVQLSNDMLPCEKWLSSLVYVLENTNYKIAALRRSNVEWKLKSKGNKQVLENGLVIYIIERPVACYMMRTDLFRIASKYVKHSNRSKYELARLVKGSVAKIHNKTCQEIEAPFQREKYDPKNKQVWEKL